MVISYSRKTWQYSLSHFNKLIWNGIWRDLYGTGWKELDNVWFLYSKNRKAESLLTTQDKLCNTPFLNSKIALERDPVWLIWDNIWFLYPKRSKAESLSATQGKLGNAPFPISINCIAIGSDAAYMRQDERNWTMSYSYIQKDGKQNRYQLLKINLAILPFQFQ